VDAAATLQAKRDLLDRGLTAAGFTTSRPSGAYFIVADAAPLGFTDAAAFCRALPGLAGVVAIPISAFVSPENGGEYASLVPWLSELSDSIGVLHLQNHDYRADAHWGWPDARGAYDPAGFFREVRDAGLEDVPVFIEVFSPFEQADDEILPLIRSSLAACRG